MINDKMKIIAEQQTQRVVLKGNTIKYNNQAQADDFNDTFPTTTNGITISKVNGRIVLNGTSTSQITFLFHRQNVIVNGHKYFTINLKSNGLSLWGVYDIDEPHLVTATDNNDYLAITIKENKTFNNYVFNTICIDLTLLGLDSISTLADFYATDLGKFILNGNYLPYSANNTIYSVKSPFTFKGRNLINYKTTYDNTCFELVGNVLKNIVADQRQNDRISFSIYSWDYGSAGGKNIDTNGRFAIELHPTQSGEYNFYHSGSSTNIYITKFYLIGGETYTLSLDVISHDSRVVGGFEIANIQLEKGNEATPYLAYDNQLVYIRTKRVDLGTLTWTYSTTTNRFSAPMPSGSKKAINNSTKGYIICGTYENASYNDTLNHIKDKLIAIDNGGYVYIYDTSKNDLTAQEFKTAMSGVILEYETAEPLELNGIGTNYDTFENHSGKVVRKIKRVKINDLDLTKSGSNFNVTLTDIKSHSHLVSVPQILCSDYNVVSAAEITLAPKAIAQNRQILTIKDSDYSSVSALKSAKGNVDIYYILETQTTENERSVLVDHRYNKVVDSNGNEIDTD